MNRFWSSILACLAATLAIASQPAVAGNSSFAVQGGMVDSDVPATYRLPAVAPANAPAPTIVIAQKPLFAAPGSDEPVRRPETHTVTGSTEESHPNEVSLPAGTPPDDSRAHATAAGNVASTAQPSLPAVPPSAPPSEPIQTVAGITKPVFPATAPFSPQLLPAVQRGTGLAERGALHAARTEFIQVLRRLAQAKDAAANSDDQSRALAAGLRALDEAADFVPEGVQLEAEMNVRSIASSHRTPVLAEEDDVTPFEAIAFYHSFAQKQLAKAAAAERAGSMSLYGLGRVHARLAEQSDDDLEQTRVATTMYAAALEACPDNHLAANELGVLVCRAGRVEEACRLFEQAINVSPSSTAYHNLAMAQRRLGKHHESAANEQESQRLASWERSRGDLSRRAGIRWVARDELASAGQSNQWTVATSNSPPPTTGQNLSEQRFSVSKVFLRLGDGDRNGVAQSESYPQVSRPVGHAAGQHRWR
jgi:tetratricopeptide (TPR) repeat protein